MGKKSLLTSVIKPMHQCENLTLQSNFSISWTKIRAGEETFHWQQSILPLLQYTGIWYRKFNIHNN